MNTNHGFSLIEVLVSLVLITSTSLALLKQQWQVSQFFNQIQGRVNALTQLDNASERLLAGYHSNTVPVPFQMSETQTDRGFGLQITWKYPSFVDQDACLRREVVVD